MTSAGSSERRGRRAAALLALAALAPALLIACGGAASGPATSASPSGPAAPTPAAGAASPSPAARPHAPDDDWGHVLQVVANLRAAPPRRPLVVLLGGSAARECTVSDEDWAREIGRQGGLPVAAFNLGSRNRTLAENLALVEALPRVRALVFIGVNLGAFTSTRARARLTLPPPATPLPAYRQHRYSPASRLTPARKRRLVRDWLEERAPAFERAFPDAARTLERLVVACRERGFTPVLLELPRDTTVTGRRLDPYVGRYRALCRRLSRRHGVPWVSFVDRLPLGDRDFYDLWHLVEPGRSLWQEELARVAVRLLAR